MRLVLLDIDGTLLDCGRQTRPFFGAALCEAFGVAGEIDAYDFPGRAERLAGRRFAPAEALIVGDSRLDVACARAHGIPSLAVATGQTSAAALREAGADWVVADLVAAGGVVDLFAG